MAALVAPAAHAEDGRLHLEPVHRHIFFNGETDNTVGGPATAPKTEHSVIVLRAGYDLPPVFMVEAMLGLGSCYAIAGTPASPIPFHPRINHSVGLFGKLWTSPCTGAAAHPRIGVTPAMNIGSVGSFAASGTSGGMACGAAGQVGLSDALSLCFDAAQHRSNGHRECSADGVGTALEA